MRVTNQMLTNNFMRDVNTNLENMSKIQTQMTSGKQIQKPSDDPYKVSRVLQINSDISSNVQYGQNITDTTNYLDTTDTALGQAGDVLTRINELLVSSGDASYTSDERQANKNEINQKIAQLSQIMNTNYDGKYIFGGTRTDTKPVNTTTGAVTGTTGGNTILSFNSKLGAVIDNTSAAPQADADEYGMIKANLSVEISQGVSMDYSVSADEINKFTTSAGGSVSLMDVGSSATPATYTEGLLNRITDDLDTNNVSNLTGKDLSDIGDAINNVLRLRSEVGAKSNRMTDAQSKNQDENDNMTALLSQTEDIDITQKTMEYATMQTVYTASLQTSSKILEKTLLDYL